MWQQSTDLRTCTVLAAITGLNGGNGVCRGLAPVVTSSGTCSCANVAYWRQSLGPHREAPSITRTRFSNRAPSNFKCGIPPRWIEIRGFIYSQCHIPFFICSQVIESLRSANPGICNGDMTKDQAMNCRATSCFIGNFLSLNVAWCDSGLANWNTSWKRCGGRYR
jgi:hypothetical protein